MMKRNLLVIGLAALLSACGFQLRGTGTSQFALTDMSVEARNAYGDTVKQVRQTLSNSGVNVHEGAQYKLVLVNEQENTRAASYNSGGRSAEYELTSKVDYEIRAEGDLVLTTDSVEVQNFYQQDSNNLIGSDQQAAQMRKELRHDLVQQLVQRLSLITPTQLEQLQLAAEQRVRAEAQAAEAARQYRESQMAPQQSPLELPRP